MIFEMVDERMLVLQNQWQDLKRAFTRLSASLQINRPRLLDDTLKVADPFDPSSKIRLEAACQQEVDAIERFVTTWRRPALDVPSAPTLFREAAEQFVGSRERLNQIEDVFFVPFPPDPAADDSTEVLLCRSELKNVREYIKRSLQDFEEVTTDEGARFSVRGIHGSVENLASYPLLTTDLGSAPSAPATTGASGGTSLRRTIDTAMREVLGRVPQPKDTRSFTAALAQSFQIVAVDGHTEYSWTPRRYAGQTELGGGVTGAQASLYTRAQVAIDNSLPLLAGLAPLLPDADDEELDAARAIVRTQFNELVTELGTEGGPRAERVEILFNSLLEDRTTGLDGVEVSGGKLGYLQEVAGLKPGQVNTLEEETAVTNFVLLNDYVQSLRQSWNTFTQGYGRDLGTRLVLLSRALSVVAEGVEEAYAAMDSVFVGPAERQVARFRTADGRPVLVEEFLSWVRTYAADEAPLLVNDGGRRGVEAIIPTAIRLRELCERFIDAIAGDPSLPDGLRHPRVLHPLREVHGYLGQVQQLAEDVRRP